MKRQPTLLPVLLALLLLLTQHMGFVHAMSHWPDGGRPASHGKQLPVEQACEQCMVYAQFGATPTSFAAMPLAQDLTYPAPAACDVQPLAAATIIAFRSRAPPVLLSA